MLKLSLRWLFVSRESSREWEDQIVLDTYFHPRINTRALLRRGQVMTSVCFFFAFRYPKKVERCWKLMCRLQLGLLTDFYFSLSLEGSLLEAGSWLPMPHHLMTRRLQKLVSRIVGSEWVHCPRERLGYIYSTAALQSRSFSLLSLSRHMGLLMPGKIFIHLPVEIKQASSLIWSYILSCSWTSRSIMLCRNSRNTSSVWLQEKRPILRPGHEFNPRRYDLVNLNSVLLLHVALERRETMILRCDIDSQSRTSTNPHLNFRSYIAKQDSGAPIPSLVLATILVNISSATHFRRNLTWIGRRQETSPHSLDLNT